MDGKLGRTTVFLLFCLVKEQFVANPSQLIQPLISTDAISTLTNIVPGGSVVDGIERAQCLPSRADSVSRYRQVVLTSIPLVAADLLAIAASYLVSTLITYAFFGAHYYWGLWNNLFSVCLCHIKKLASSIAAARTL